jgi:hypothetical protein
MRGSWSSYGDHEPSQARWDSTGNVMLRDSWPLRPNGPGSPTDEREEHLVDDLGYGVLVGGGEVAEDFVAEQVDREGGDPRDPAGCQAPEATAAPAASLCRQGDRDWGRNRIAGW